MHRASAQGFDGVHAVGFLERKRLSNVKVGNAFGSFPVLACAHHLFYQPLALCTQGSLRIDAHLAGIIV